MVIELGVAELLSSLGPPKFPWKFDALSKQLSCSHRSVPFELVRDCVASLKLFLCVVNHFAIFWLHNQWFHIFVERTIEEEVHAPFPARPVVGVRELSWLHYSDLLVSVVRLEVLSHVRSLDLAAKLAFPHAAGFGFLDFETIKLSVFHSAAWTY